LLRWGETRNANGIFVGIYPLQEKVLRSYRMASRKEPDTGNRKRKDQIALCGELALEGCMVAS